MDPVAAGLAGYVLLQLAIGAAASRFVRGEADYLIAGRRLGPWLGTASTFATWFGAETCIGAAGMVYVAGLAGTSADPLGYAACLLLMGALLAFRLRALGLVTLGDLFRDRYGVAVERLAVVLMVPTSILWAAAQIRAFGQVLAVSSSVELELAIAVATIVVIAYTAVGGLLSDAVTDLVQGALLIAGLVVLVATVDTGPALAAVDPARLSLAGDRSALAVAESFAVPVLGSLVAQELVARVLAIRSPGLARRSTIAAGGIYLAVGAIPVVLGLAGPALLPGLEDPDAFLPTLARQQLPPLLYVVFAGALLSAILSTVDSALLAASALATHNAIGPLLGLSDRGRLRLARGAVVAGGVLAWVLATRAEGVHDLVSTASAFGSSGIVVVVLAATFTRTGGPASAITALLAGAIAWGAGSAAEIEAPYLLSVAVAAGGYAVTAWIRPAPQGRLAGG